MLKTKLRIFALLGLLSKGIDAGVIVGSEIPSEVITVAESLSARLQVIVCDSQHGISTKTRKYIFDPALKYYLPHLSLAYLTRDTISLEAFLEKHDASGSLRKSLEQIAANTDSIDLSDTLREAQLEFWQGKLPVELSLPSQPKKVYNNYYLVVLKLREAPELRVLAGQVAKSVSDNLHIEQRFPFSSHITIGRIVGANDEPLVGTFVERMIKPHFEDKKVADLVNIKPARFEISNFKMKGDGDEAVYALRSRMKTS